MEQDRSSKASASRRRNSGFVKERSLALPLDRDAWMPAPYDNADIAAIKALAEGRAEPYQQQLALEWIVYISGTYENSFRPGVDGARNTDFAAGKQFVGQQVVKLVNMPTSDAEQGEQG